MSKMYISKEFNHLVERKYKEMKELGKNEDLLDEINFGEIKIFISPKEEPKFSLLKITMPNGDLVNVGSN